MTPLTALRILEIAAERIGEEPQTGQQVRDALNVLRGRVQRWRLDYLWEYLQVDATGANSALIGAQQNLSAALNGIAMEMRAERLGPVELAAAVKEAKAR